MIIKGLIGPVSDGFTNVVNVDFTAKQKGIRISEHGIILVGHLKLYLIGSDSDLPI